MKIRIIIKYICIALLLCLFHTGFAESLTTAKPEAFELNPIDIGIKISHGQDIIAADDFYPALLNQQEQPYLNISSLFEQLFAYTVNCNDTNHCEVISKPADWNIVFSLKDQNVAVNNKGKVAVYHFDKDSLVEYKHQLWLRYDQMDKILPMNSRWDIRGYQLNINTDLPVLAMMIEKRKSQNQKILAQQKQRQQEQEQLSKLSPLTPSHAVDGALFYQLNDNEAVSGSNTSSRQAQFSGVADIFQGTLAGSGSISQPRTGPIPYTWNYTISKPPYFRTAQIGDTNTNNTAFLGSYQLTNGIKFDKMQGQTASLQFVYYGQTLPGTEVDVWRNGTYLVGIYFADNSGQFTVTDNQASPGDIYTLNYYYTDGKSKVDYVRFASDKGNLLKQGDVDVDVNYGRLDQGDQYMGHAGQSLIRYGVAPGVTMGWGTYYLNFGNDFYNSNSSQLTNQSYLIHYADLAWQAFDSLNLQIDKMLNTSGYAVHATSNYLQNNVLEVSYRNLSDDNPLLLMPSSLLNPTAAKALEIKNSFSFSKWRWVNDYWNTNLNEQYTSTLSTYYNKWLSPSLSVGFNKPVGSNTALVTQFNNTIMINNNSFMQLGYNWTKGGGTTQSVQYTYNGANQKNYSISAGLTHSNVDGSNQPSLGLNWRVTNNWNLGANYINSGVMLSVSFSDAISLFKSPQLPGQYSLGSISGRVLSPSIPGHKQVPVEGAKVVVGGVSAVTDKQGNYSVSGIPTGMTQFLSVDPDSLDVSMIPETDKVPLIFRPGTHIEYNPVLVSNIGIDGYIFSDNEIPADAELLAVRQNGVVYSRIGKIESDGFFSIEKLTPGKYVLKLEGVKNPPAPYPLDIGADQTWISNIQIKWQYTEPKANANSQPGSKQKQQNTVGPGLDIETIFKNNGLFVSPVQISVPKYSIPAYLPKTLPHEVQVTKPKLILPTSPVPPTAELNNEDQQINQMLDNIVSQEKNQSAAKLIEKSGS